MPKRQSITPTNQWKQLDLRLTDPTQRTYELIHPVVLFGQSPSERAQETAANQRMLYRHVERFTEQGMAGLDPDQPLLPRRLDTLTAASNGSPS